MDGANIMGKSVEMLSQAIENMRSYGEGFLIVDQSPELMDKSVIRNTSTKIFMNLPEYEDKKTAGRSIGLSDEQIKGCHGFRLG